MLLPCVSPRSNLPSDTDGDCLESACIDPASGCCPVGGITHSSLTFFYQIEEAEREINNQSRIDIEKRPGKSVALHTHTHTDMNICAEVRCCVYLLIRMREFELEAET